MPSSDPSSGEPSADGGQRHSKLRNPTKPFPQAKSAAPWLGLTACVAVSVGASTMATRWRLPALSPQLLVAFVGMLSGLVVFAALKARSALRCVDQMRERLMSAEDQVNVLTRVESGLRQAEEQFRRAFADANVGMVIVGCDLNLRHVNDAFGQMLGYTRSELIGRSVIELTHPEDRDVTTRSIQSLIQDAHHRVSVEKRYAHRDGHVVWGLSNVALVRDENNAPRFFVAHVQNITEARRATEQLRVNAERLRACIENTPNVAVQWYDRDGRVIYWNRASEGLVGWNSSEAVGRSPAELFATGNDPDEFLRSIREIEQSGQTIGPFECDVRHRDGSQRICLSTLFAIPAAGGERYFVCMDVDITEAKKAVRALADSKERLRAIVETIEEVFWIAEPGKVHAIYISPAVEKIWGHPPDRFLQDPTLVLETIHPEDRPTFLRAVERQAAGQHTSIEYRVFHADGSVRWIWDQGFPVRNGEGRLVAVNGLATNITERKRLEAQLRQAQKMEAIGTLAGGIAHDFNNILGSIIGFTELARLDAAGSETVLQSLNDVLKASRRAKGLVQQILAFSRQQESHRQPVQFGPIVREAAKLLRAAAPASIQWSVEIPETLSTVLADPTQLHQIIMNLGTNAIQAIGHGQGAVSLHLDEFAIDETLASAHPGITAGAHVRLTVSDSGSGMNAVTMDHMFDPFFTTKAPGEGSGLGLSVVHGIVKNHQGAITVQSQPGKGTSIEILLPAGTADIAPADATESVTPPARNGQGEHILFVDDEPALGIVGRRVLQCCGFRVTVKNDPVEALETFQKTPQDFALVITDLTMPSMDGLTLAAKLLRLRPGLPILLTTGYGAGITVEAARRAGFQDLLLKPSDLESIGDAVTRALALKSNGT
jgi:PAS domain S-box-containing protein